MKSELSKSVLNVTEIFLHVATPPLLNVGIIMSFGCWGDGLNKEVNLPIFQMVPFPCSKISPTLIQNIYFQTGQHAHPYFNMKIGNVWIHFQNLVIIGSEVYHFNFKWKNIVFKNIEVNAELMLSLPHYFSYILFTETIQNIY